MTPRQMCPRPNRLGRSLRSKTRWFTGFSNLHQVAHFATFFIDARAKLSVVESCLCLQSSVLPPARSANGVRGGGLSIVVFLGAFHAGVCWSTEEITCLGRREGGARRVSAAPLCLKRVRGSFCYAGFDNDPSEGSPTKTLLRLLLPLNDKFNGLLATSRAANRPRRRDPNISPDHSIGRSDGRCVQRAGT